MPVTGGRRPGEEMETPTPQQRGLRPLRRRLRSRAGNKNLYSLTPVTYDSWNCRGTRSPRRCVGRRPSGRRSPGRLQFPERGEFVLRQLTQPKQPSQVPDPHTKWFAARCRRVIDEIGRQDRPRTGDVRPRARLRRLGRRQDQTLAPAMASVTGWRGDPTPGALRRPWNTGEVMNSDYSQSYLSVPP